MVFYLLLFLAGLMGGLVSGLLGVGGGIVYILILPVAFEYLGLPAQEIAQFTIANSLLGTFFAASFATFNHIKHKEFYPRAIISICITSIIAAILTLYFVVNTPLYSKEVFNIVVIILLVVMLLSTLFNAKKQEGFIEKEERTLGILSITGISAGVTSALTGLGGGIIIIPFLNQGLKMGVKKAKAISLGVIMLTSFAMVIYNLFQSPMTASEIEMAHTGYILFQVTIPLILGTLLTARMGVKISRKLKASYVSYLFAAFIILVVIKKVIEII